MNQNVYSTPISPARQSGSCPGIIRPFFIRTPIKGGKELFPETPEKENKELVCPDAPRREKNQNDHLPVLIAIPFPNLE